MNAKDYVEYKPGTVRSGKNKPEFLCSVCNKWFQRLLYWRDKKFNPEQGYRIIFYCGAECSLVYEQGRFKKKKTQGEAKGWV